MSEVNLEDKLLEDKLDSDEQLYRADTVRQRSETANMRKYTGKVDDSLDISPRYSELHGWISTIFRRSLRHKILEILVRHFEFLKYTDLLFVTPVDNLALASRRLLTMRNASLAETPHKQGIFYHVYLLDLAFRVDTVGLIPLYSYVKSKSVDSLDMESYISLAAAEKMRRSFLQLNLTDGADIMSAWHIHKTFHTPLPAAIAVEQMLINSYSLFGKVDAYFKLSLMQVVDPDIFTPRTAQQQSRTAEMMTPSVLFQTGIVGYISFRPGITLSSKAGVYFLFTTLKNVHPVLPYLSFRISLVNATPNLIYHTIYTHGIIRGVRQLVTQAKSHIQSRLYQLIRRAKNHS